MRVRSGIGFLKCLLVGVMLSFACLTGEAQVNYGHFIRKARLDLTEGRYKESIAGLNVAIASRPENFEGYFLRGMAKYGLEDFHGAIVDFDKTLELHPMYVRALQYRGICYDRLGRHNEALADFQHALDLDPFDADIYFSRGATHLHLGRYEEAIEDYDMVLTIRKDLSLAYVNRGLAKSKLQRFEEALSDLDMAVYYDFLNPEVYFHRGVVRMDGEEYAEALTDFNESIRLDGKRPLTYFNRALVELHLGDTLAALDDYEKVNQLDERNALTYFNRGLLYGMRKDYDKALEMFGLVTVINPNNIYGYFNRSIVYCDLHRWADAEQDLTHVLQLFPEFISAWVNRSIVRHEQGNRMGSEADHLMAMNLIRLFNGDGSDTEALYRKYADSTYFNRIMAFESDFINGETKSSQLQYADVQIRPWGAFVVCGIGQEGYQLLGKSNGLYLDAGLAQINSSIDAPYKLVMIPDGMESAEAVLPYGETKSDEKLALFLQGISSHENLAYQKAKSCYGKLIDDPLFGAYAVLNLSSLLMTEAEMTALSATKEPVSISKGKNEKETEPSVSPVDYSNTINLLIINLIKNNNNSFLWYNLGNAYLQAKEYSDAIDAYTEAIRLNADLAEAYYNRALTLIFVGERQLALSDLSKAGELGLTEAYAVMKRFVNDSYRN